MSNKKIKINLNCMGCAWFVLWAIVFVFVITHVFEIWAALEKLLHSV